MNRPLLALAGIAILGTAGAAGALALVPFGGEEEVAQQVTTPTPARVGAKDPGVASPATPSPAAEQAAGRRLRWGQVTIDYPDPSFGITVAPRLSASDVKEIPIGTWRINRTIEIKRTDATLAIHIDGETGEIIRHEVSSDDRELLQPILDSVQIEPLDRSTAPWPYSGPPPSQRGSWGNITYPEPDPLSGIMLQVGTSDGPLGPLNFIMLANGSSLKTYDASTGLEILSVYPVPGKVFAIDELDRAAFDRFTESIEVTN